jgi:hypothetical protein
MFGQERKLKRLKYQILNPMAAQFDIPYKSLENGLMPDPDDVPPLRALKLTARGIDLCIDLGDPDRFPARGTSTRRRAAKAVTGQLIRMDKRGLSAYMASHRGGKLLARSVLGLMTLFGDTLDPGDRENLASSDTETYARMSATIKDFYPLPPQETERFGLLWDEFNETLKEPGADLVAERDMFLSVVELRAVKYLLGRWVYPEYNEELIEAGADDEEARAYRERALASWKAAAADYRAFASVVTV